MSIEKQLELKFPIYWNDWPIEEEFAKYLVYKIITHRPVNIVELGSGTSSLIIIKTLEKLGYDYILTSFDSDEEFINNTKNLLISEDVFDEKKVKLIFSPIKDLELNGNVYKWYDPNYFEFNFEKIDLLFVDGPVGDFCKNSRYPALSVIKKYLKNGSMVILHDAKRLDEIEIVEMWKNENPEIKNFFKIETERGGVEMRF
ncbi:MAG: class I SAM-dependent methyltransferase [Parcubacteria group bacterium]|jgi:predicted O-methyltransferase YrrM